MDGGGADVRDARWLRVSIWIHLALFLALNACLTGASPVHGPRLICWQAIMKCQGEEACNYAYSQYMHACGPVIAGQKKKCPSHCISSIVQLNLTANGPGLEDCECASDPVCRSTKLAIEPCVPKIRRHTGCTEARKECAKDAECNAAMRDYLHHCRKLFGGSRCSNECRRVISRMRAMPKALRLETCECDGTERTICEYVKVRMRSFCFGPAHGDAGSGFSDDDEDDYEGDDYEEEAEEEKNGAGMCAGRVAWAVAWAAVGLVVTRRA